MPSLRSILRRRDSREWLLLRRAGRAPRHPSATPIDLDGRSISLDGTGFGVTALGRSTRRRPRTRPLADRSAELVRRRRTDQRRASAEGRKHRRSGAFPQAAEGTRTLDLLLASARRAF